jgi:hypothetical protein
MGVPFISQFIPQPLRSFVGIEVLVRADHAGWDDPAAVSLNALMPTIGRGASCRLLVLSLIRAGSGQQRALPLRSDRNIFSIFGAVRRCSSSVLWSAITSGVGGPLALVQSVAVAGSVSLILLMIADIRHGGTDPQALNTAKQPA